MKLHDKKTSHRKVGARSESRSSTTKESEGAGNYRPICSLPVLYKLFATVLYARLAPIPAQNPTSRPRLPTKVDFGPIIELMII